MAAQSVTFWVSPEKYNVLVFGVNPSTATPENDDPTIRKVREIVKNNGYDGWIMMNLYPLISTDPSQLSESADKKLIKKNLKVIKAVVESYTIGAV